jgi:hypothetical protein
MQWKSGRVHLGGLRVALAVARRILRRFRVAEKAISQW